jgi:hypothetical protein
MANWNSARLAWLDFLEEVARARARLNCSISNAWFRGQTNAEWNLVPSLFREEIPDRLSADAKRSIDQLEAEIKERKRLSKLKLDRIKECKELQQLARSNPNPQQLRFASEDYRETKSSFEKLKKEIAARESLIQNVKAVHYGERDAYIDFRFRCQSQHSSSWETLGEMQHYKVPTRLLDWTEVLALAVFFALEKYIDRLNKFWTEKPNQTLRFKLPKLNTTPCIWILNPYILAREAVGQNTILDLSVEPELDYYRRFFLGKNWPYEKPVPSYSPWKNPRLAAQQGMFTVHGLSKQSIDLQAKESVEKVILSPEAAVYGVMHLKTFLGLDKFIMFRDSDSLGDRVKQRFIAPAKPNPEEPQSRQKRSN